MKSLLDPSFQYVPACATDVRATFAKVREQQRLEAERAAARAHVESLQTHRVLSIFETRLREMGQ